MLIASGMHCGAVDLRSDESRIFYGYCVLQHTKLKCVHRAIFSIIGKISLINQKELHGSLSVMTLSASKLRAALVSLRSVVEGASGNLVAAGIGLLIGKLLGS